MLKGGIVTGGLRQTFAQTQRPVAIAAAAAPRCRIARMPGTGHALHREQPRRVAALVHELCARTQDA